MSTDTRSERWVAKLREWLSSCSVVGCLACAALRDELRLVGAEPAGPDEVPAILARVEQEASLTHD